MLNIANDRLSDSLYTNGHSTLYARVAALFYSNTSVAHVLWLNVTSDSHANLLFFSVLANVRYIASEIFPFAYDGYFYAFRGYALLLVNKGYSMTIETYYWVPPAFSQAII